MKIYLKRTLHGFGPGNEESAKYIKKYKLGDVYYFDVKKVQKQRNWKLLQKYWVMIGICLENQEKYFDKNHLHIDIKKELNIGEWKTRLNGENYFDVGSVAMDKMNEEDFEKFYSRAIDIVLKYVLVGTDESELNNAVNEIIKFG